MKHRLILFILVLGLGLGKARAQDDFEIRIKAKQVIPGKKIFLEYINARGQAVKLDSLLPDAQQQVVFKGKVLDQGAFYVLNFFDVVNPQRILLVLEGGEKVEVQADGVQSPDLKASASISSNALALKQMVELMQVSAALQQQVQVWNAELQKQPNERQRIQLAFEKAQAETKAKVKAIIQQMGTHLVALWATNFLNQEEDFPEFEAIAARFQQSRAHHPQVKPFLENIKRLKGVAVGNEAPEIQLPTPTGASLALSSLRGKYVLIDFWASWCGPCRVENPNVVKTYAKFKDKGFEILGVSLDQNKAAWIKAIETDGLVWKHVSDLQYWNSVAAQAYRVNAIPMTYLLDPQGKILAKGLRGAKLDEYLQALFKTP